MAGISDFKDSIGAVKFLSLTGSLFAWLIGGLLFSDKLGWSNKCDYGRGFVNLLKTLYCSPSLLAEGWSEYIHFAWLWFLPAWIIAVTVIWIRADG
jgi:hypothetical protein